MKALLAAAIAMALLAACSSGDDASPTSTTGLNSGIDGTVLEGPVCPVSRPESPCPDRPLAGASIRITSEAGGQAIERVSDAEGRFRADLPLGKYTVTPLPLNGMAHPAPGQPQTVTVVAGRYVPVTLSYDTGIR